MTPAELEKLRGVVAHGFDLLNYEARSLLAHIDQLTGELERARDLAVRSGVFQSDDCDHDWVTTMTDNGAVITRYCGACEVDA